MSGRFENKVAFITGAARGQGRSHAVRLAEEGADVIAIDACTPIGSVAYPMASLEDLEETARLVESLGRRVVARQVDVRDAEALAVAVDDGVGELGRLDVVSANAGILSASASTEMTASMWQDMIDVNLTGVWHTAKAAIPHLVAGGRGGSIVITSSVAGLRANPGIAHYAAAKHGVVGVMRSLALELAPHMIRVNSIHPTQVDTTMAMNEPLWRRFSPGVADPGIDDFAAVSQSMHALPVPWLEPVDVSNALLFLASEEARYITGLELVIDAGAMLKGGITSPR